MDIRPMEKLEKLYPEVLFLRSVHTCPPDVCYGDSESQLTGLTFEFGFICQYVLFLSLLFKVL